MGLSAGSKNVSETGGYLTGKHRRAPEGAWVPGGGIEIALTFCTETKCIKECKKGH